MFSDKSFALQTAVAAEVEEKADFESGCFEIVEDLGVFLSSEFIERFHLD